MTLPKEISEWIEEEAIEATEINCIKCPRQIQGGK